MTRAPSASVVQEPAPTSELAPAATRFVRGAPAGEYCGSCGKHISQHFGWTEYFCRPRPNPALPAGPADLFRDELVRRLGAERGARAAALATELAALIGLTDQSKPELRIVAGIFARLSLDQGISQREALDLVRQAWETVVRHSDLISGVASPVGSPGQT